MRLQNWPTQRGRRPANFVQKKTSPRTHVRLAGVSTSLSTIMAGAAAEGIGFRA
jgi:hypothetical protein